MVSIFSNLIPMREPLETAELLAFSKTVDAKSLSRAAAELGVPRATISRRLQRLEEQLGVRLLRRTTRRLVLTDAGEAFYRQARLVLEAVENAQASVTRPDGALRGELRISVPPFQIESFYALLTEFAERHPEVRVHAHFGSQYVDLVRGGYDVALRASRALEPGLVARTLMRFPQIAVASPSYLERFGTPKSLSDLRKHRCLAGFDRGELPQTHWPLADGGRHAIEPWLASNDLNLLLEAAERGLGIAFLPLMTIRTAMEERQVGARPTGDPRSAHGRGRGLSGARIHAAASARLLGSHGFLGEGGVSEGHARVSGAATEAGAAPEAQEGQEGQRGRKLTS